MSLITFTEAWVAEFPALSAWLAVIKRLEESAAAETLKGPAVQLLVLHVVEVATPPTLTATALEFSEHVPLSVYEVSFELLMFGATVIATVGFAVSFRTVVLACGALFVFASV